MRKLFISKILAKYRFRLFILLTGIFSMTIAFGVINTNNMISRWMLRYFERGPEGILEYTTYFIMPVILVSFALITYELSNSTNKLNKLKNPKIKDLDKLIEDGEGSKREWKATAKYSVKTKQSDKDLYYPIIKGICAMSNTEGGVILVGYDENSKKFIGIENDGFDKNTDKWENWLRQKLDHHSRQTAIWVQGINFEYHIHDNVTCALINIKKQENPVECSGIGNNKQRLYTYVRAGAYTRQLDSPSEIIEHFKDR